MLYKARKEAIKFHDYYSLIPSEAKNKAKNKAKNEGKELKILTPKQMLQRVILVQKQLITQKIY